MVNMVSRSKIDNKYNNVDRNQISDNITSDHEAHK